MKNRIHLFFLFCLLCLSSGSAQSQQLLLNQPSKATAYPGQNFSPAVSPDGSRMAFISDRGGNLDIYVQPLGQPGARATKATSYSGVDKAPAWAPDGKRMAFVSNREDPDGDIIVMGLSEKEEIAEQASKPLTGIDSADSFPAWAPDGKAIFFSSRPKTENQENIWKIDVEKGTKVQATPEGGTMPSVSPDGKYMAFVNLKDDPNGNIYIMRLSDEKIVTWTTGREAEGSPAWDPSGRKIYFSRCADDTNLDGELSFQDNSSIWSAEFSEDLFQRPEGVPKLRQLTCGETYDIFPAASRESLYYTSSPTPPSAGQGVTTGILYLPKAGALPVFQDFKTAWEKFSAADLDSPYKKIMSMRNMLLDFSPFEDPALPASLHYKIGMLFSSLNNSRQALENFQAIADKYSSSPLYAGLGRIESVVIKARDESETRPSDRQNIFSSAVVDLKKLAAEFKSNPVVSGTARLRTGDFFLLMKKHEKAMDVYDRVYNEYAGQKELAAEALFSKSKIYLDLDDKDKLQEAFLNVIRQFPDAREWKKKAVEEILRLNAESGPIEKRAERLYRLSDKYAELPLLPAAALNKAGDIYYKEHENLKAKQAHLRTLERFPNEKEEIARARFALAKIYFEEEDFERTFQTYRELEVDPASAFQSKREFVSKLLAKGDKEMQAGEARLAVKTFKSIIEYDYEIIEAHRGFIKAYAALNQAADAANLYKKDVERLEKAVPIAVPSISAARYALGLALTYLQPPQLEEAGQHIQKAISLNGNSPYYFQTLGWLREQKYQETGNNEHLESASDSYQTSISLNLAQGLTQNLPDLWLNLGNAQYLIQNFGGAYRNYMQRLESKTSFGAGKEAKSREAIYFQRFGEVSFKLAKTIEAAEYFGKAVSLLEGVDPAKSQKQIAELHARIALVYQDSGEYEKAVEYFGKALDVYAKAGDGGNVARALRNIANNLYFSTQGKEDRAGRSETLNKALGRYFETVKLLEKGALAPVQKKKKKGALIQVDIEQGLDEDSSRAAMGFSKSDEEKLIFNYIGKIYGDFREYAKAVEYFQKKLSLTPSDLPVEGNVPILLERAIIENQIGNYLYLSGDSQGALASFQRSLDVSVKIKNNFGVATNSMNMGKLCAESLLASKQIDGPSIYKTLDQLDQAARTLMADPAYIHNGVLAALKNQSGVIAFSLAQESEEARPKKKEGADASIVSASLKELDGRLALLKNAQKYFKEGLDALGQIPAGKAKFNTTAARSVLENNLLATNSNVNTSNPKFQISNLKSEIPNLLLLPPDLRWRLTFISSISAPSDEAEIKILFQARDELLAVPYSYKKIGDAERETARELFARLAWLLMKADRKKEAFLAADLGREWELKSGHEGAALSFENRGTDEAYRKLIKASSKIRDLYSSLENGGSAGEVEKWNGEVSQSQAAYNDALKDIQAKFPDLASLVSYMPADGILKNAQSLLGKDEALVRAFSYKDSILEWTITKDAIEGSTGAATAASDFSFSFFNLKSQISNLKYKRLYLIPDPATASIPWPSDLQVTNIASLSHIARSCARRNLQLSNILIGSVSSTGLIGSTGSISSAGSNQSNQLNQSNQSNQNSYRNTSILTAGELNKTAFLQAMEKSGVVGLSTPATLLPKDTAHSYIDLSVGESLVDRWKTHEMYGKQREGCLIALSNTKAQPLPGGQGQGLQFLILADALSRAGYPSVLINTGAFDPKFDAVFMSAFFYRRPLTRSK